MSQLAFAADAVTGAANGGGGNGPTTSGPATILPFPVARRVTFLERTARAASSYKNPRKYLESAYRQQEDAMRRRGIAESLIEAELQILKREINSRMMEWS
jgi:hypothetical protein